MTRVSTQGSVTVTLNVITKDLARYSDGFYLCDSDWNYQQSLFRLGYETSNLRVSEKEVCIKIYVSSSIILFCIWNTLWSINFHKKNQTNWSTQGQGRRRSWGARYWSSCYQGVLVNQMCGLLNYIRIFVDCSWTRIYLSSTIKVTEPFIIGADYSFWSKSDFFHMWVLLSVYPFLSNLLFFLALLDLFQVLSACWCWLWASLAHLNKKHWSHKY